MMAKRYGVGDFDQVIFYTNQDPKTILFSNDDVSRLYSKTKPMKRRAKYLDRYKVPAIANDDPVEQKVRAEILLKQFEKLKALRGQRSKEWYQRECRRLQIGSLTLCRDPKCSVSPTAKQLRHTIDKALGGDREI